MDDEIWKKAPLHEDFRQREPDEAKPATERITFQIAYDDEALYFGVMCYDSEPNKIVSRLVRRDTDIEEDAPKVVDLYSANNAERTGTPLRTEIGWKEFTRRGGILPDPYVVLNEVGEVIGYFVCDGDNAKKDMIDRNCTLLDIGFQDRMIFQTIVHFLAHGVEYISAERIRCAIPADHPFAIFCRRYGCRTNTYTPKDHMGMMRIINQSSTLKKTTGELEKRLQRAANLSEWRGQILISTDLGQDCLEIHRGSVSHSNSRGNGFHLEMPQDKLIQLMMGRRSIEDIAIESDVSVSEEIILVLDTLFPLGHPHVWWSDRF